MTTTVLIVGIYDAEEMAELRSPAVNGAIIVANQQPEEVHMASLLTEIIYQCRITCPQPPLRYEWPVHNHKSYRQKPYKNPVHNPTLFRRMMLCTAGYLPARIRKIKKAK